jgi:hypothetical protein
MIFKFERCRETVQEVEDPELSLELGKWWDSSCLALVIIIRILIEPFYQSLDEGIP